MEPKTLDDLAIIIKPKKDNVAVVTADFIEQGTQLKYGDQLLTMSGRALCGQSFAIKDIPEGKPFISLGDPIGLASVSLKPGDPVNESNIQRRLPRLVVRYRDNPKPTQLDPELTRLTFDGYLRNDRSVGIRNLIGVVTSGMCSSTEVKEIARRAMREIYTREKFQRGWRGPHRARIRLRHAGWACGSDVEPVARQHPAASQPGRGGLY